MHGEPLPEITPQYPMTAILNKTAPEPTAPWVVPGNYSVVLTVGGQSLTQPLPVKMDPRVKATTPDLQKQFENSKTLYDLRAELRPIGKSFKALVSDLAKAKEHAGESPLQEQIVALQKKLEAFANPAEVRAGDPLELDVLNKVEKLFSDLQAVDAAPTPAQQTALGDLQREARAASEKWKEIPAQVATLNRQLEGAGIGQIDFH